MKLRCFVGLGALCALSVPAFAADHAEAPGAQADPAADITDFYAWHADGKVNAIVNYAPFLIPGDAPVYDAGALYTVHFDVDGDNLSDHDVHVRFGQASSGKWGVQVTGLPGASAPVTGLAETVIPAPGGQVFAGLRDDPFFFDLVGFETTLATGTVSFTADDAVAGANVMVIAMQFDAPSLLGAETVFQTWATSSRL